MNEEDSLSVRLRRYGQVSTAIGGLAARLAGQKFLGREIDQSSHASHLTALLGSLKGPLMKVAQFLATIPGALPPKYSEMFMSLQMNAPPMGWAFVKRRMTSELGTQWQGHFSEFPQQAAAAASLGQVHKAVDHYGNTLAVKLQYPDMDAIVQADISQLKLILSLYENWSQALDTTEVQEEIALRLREELDYHHEAQNIGYYREIVSNIEKEDNPYFSGIHIPRVFPDLSTGKLITLSWMEGQSLLSKTESPVIERNELGRKLFMAWYYPFYHYGIIHGDPHPGNYSVRENGDLNILDFGCIRIFSPVFIQGVIDLYHSLQNNDQALAVHAYTCWGFKNLTREMIDVITQWAQLIYAPLLDDRIRPIQDAADGSAGWETAMRVHKQLERLGGIRPPREFVFMDRAAVGIGSVIMRLKAEQNWHRLFERLIENFNISSVTHRQDKLLTQE
jgi:predicted unusual protein kinase regulating ubiquinone biosynthesis (AarF/ABC1/UbiB family)